MFSRALLLISLVAFAKAKGDVDPTADLLKGLKDSGVLDNVKEELEKMLHEKKVDVDQLRDELSKAKAHLPTPKEKVEDPAMTFIQKYVQEKGFKLSAETLKKLASIPGGDDKTMHFVQLTGAIDKLATSKDKETRFLKDKFAAIKDLKEFLEAKPKVEKPKPKVKNDQGSKKEDKTNVSPSKVAQTIRMFTGMAKVNPEMLVSTLFAMLAKYEIIGKESMKEMMTYSSAFVKSQTFVEGITYCGESLASLAESETGGKMFELVPLLFTEEGREEAYDKIKAETEDKWGQFFHAITNSDMKDDFLLQCGEGINSAYKYVFKDEMKMMMANAFLMSQQMPPLMPKNVLESLIDIVGHVRMPFLFQVLRSGSNFHSKLSFAVYQDVQHLQSGCGSIQRSSQAVCQCCRASLRQIR